MKKSGLKLAAVLGVSAVLFAFTQIEGGVIVGNVSPSEGVDQVLAIQGTDTVVGVNENGSFKVDGLKAGTYTLLVKAKTPFKDAQIENVSIAGSDTTKVADIVLQQ